MTTQTQATKEKIEVWDNLYNELRPKLSMNQYKIKKINYEGIIICITKIDGDSAIYQNALNDIIEIAIKYNKLYYIDFLKQNITLC